MQNTNKLVSNLQMPSKNFLCALSYLDDIYQM